MSKDKYPCIFLKTNGDYCVYYPSNIFAQSRAREYHLNWGISLGYYTTKAVRGPITNINQSDCFISGPARADILPVSDRVLSRIIPRDLAQDFCLLNQDDGKYERYFLQKSLQNS